MKDFKNYKKHIEVDMKSYSGNFHFNEQLKQEGTDIKINEQTVQTIDGVEKPIRAIVRNHGNEYNELKEERSIAIDKKYDYKVGDYVEYLDDIYLTNSAIDKDNPFFNTTKLTRCNFMLKWIDENGLHEQPCIVVNNTKYTGGTKSQNTFTEIDAMVNITIQANENTKKINYGKRLFTMKNAWRVTLIDNITTENVFSWTLGKDSINSENDNVILGVCDYYEHLYAITLDSNTQSLIETSTYQIKPTIKDEGKIVLNPNNIAYKSSDETIATVSEKGLVSALKTGNCIITCSIGSVNTTLNLTVTAKTSTPVISYTCDWSTGKTSTGASLKTYMSSIVTLDETINGVSNPSLVVNYTLDALATTLVNSKSISITRQSNTSFLVKNINVNTSKSFTINFIDSSNNSVINTSIVNLTKGI